ncbi:hypothetical protein QVD17_37895 [Tagetes erecta]|uniref:Uncharacterized protein n=1 Tax=Tagetes erecta TaxID=13708 RepID=A0AAD8NJM2_TARER|nr:hypothetical protein QVD17_37895 [Tagetes erecta]
MKKGSVGKNEKCGGVVSGRKKSIPLKSTHAKKMKGSCDIRKTTGRSNLGGQVDDVKEPIPKTRNVVKKEKCGGKGKMKKVNVGDGENEMPYLRTSARDSITDEGASKFAGWDDDFEEPKNEKG